MTWNRGRRVHRGFECFVRRCKKKPERIPHQIVGRHIKRASSQYKTLREESTYVLSYPNRLCTGAWISAAVLFYQYDYNHSNNLLLTGQGPVRRPLRGCYGRQPLPWVTPPRPWLQGLRGLFSKPCWPEITIINKMGLQTLYYITESGFEACFGWDARHQRCCEQNTSRIQMLRHFGFY